MLPVFSNDYSSTVVVYSLEVSCSFEFQVTPEILSFPRSKLHKRFCISHKIR